MNGSIFSPISNVTTIAWASGAIGQNAILDVEVVTGPGNGPTSIRREVHPVQKSLTIRGHVLVTDPNVLGAAAAVAMAINGPLWRGLASACPTTATTTTITM